MMHFVKSQWLRRRVERLPLFLILPLLDKKLLKGEKKDVPLLGITGKAQQKCKAKCLLENTASFS